MSDFTIDPKTWEMLFCLGKEKAFKPGEIIYFQGESNIGLVVLKKGKIKNSILLSDGTEKQLNIFEAPYITDETSVVDDGTSVCCAIAVTDVTVAIVPPSEARELLFTNYQLTVYLLQVYAQKTRSLMLQLEGVVTTVSQRLALMLLAVEGYGVYVHKEHTNRLLITHEEMARFIGTTRPRITEILTELTKFGIIERGRGYITILDREKLEEIRQYGLKK